MTDKTAALLVVLLAAIALPAGMYYDNDGHLRFSDGYIVQGYDEELPDCFDGKVPWHQNCVSHSLKKERQTALNGENQHGSAIAVTHSDSRR